MMNPTLQKFVTSTNVLFETAHWVVVLRPAQVTLGAAIIISRAHVTAVADLDADAFVDLRTAMQKLNALYAVTLQPDKINYLALMMVDPNPHFHALPRYAAPRAFDGAFYDDASWPNPPALDKKLALSPDQQLKLVQYLKNSI